MNDKINPYDNVSISIEDNVLTIRVNVDSDAVQPKLNRIHRGMGKSMVWGTTGGATKVGGFSVNLIVYQKG